MEGDKRDRWVLSILFIFALVGVITAIQGKNVLSGIFALYFLGYFLVRLQYLLKRPVLRLPAQVIRSGYILASVGFLLFLIHLVAKYL